MLTAMIPGLLGGNYSGARSLRPPHSRCGSSSANQVREQFGNAVMCVMSGQPILPGRRLVWTSAKASRSKCCASALEPEMSGGECE
jgi:hypothetical protein